VNQRIDQFCENLRVKLTSIDNNMKSIKGKIDSKAQSVDKDVRSHLDGVKKRMEQDRAKWTTAQADMKKWAEERKAATNEKVAEWKSKLEIAKLQSRAEGAKRYAEAAAVMAAAAVDEAEQASLEAWLARKDAETVQGTKAA
jgi:hypothetical protein